MMPVPRWQARAESRTAGNLPFAWRSALRLRKKGTVPNLRRNLPRAEPCRESTGACYNALPRRGGHAFDLDTDRAARRPWRRTLGRDFSSPQRIRRAVVLPKSPPGGLPLITGGASPGAPQGEGNGMWRHGLRSIEAIERRRKATAEMRKIRREMQELARF